MLDHPGDIWSFTDILSINQIWIDVKVTHQGDFIPSVGFPGEIDYYI